jgi:hypothetical protein
MAKSIQRAKKRTALIAVAAILTLGGAGAAFAYWTSGGWGAGTATTGTSDEFEFTVNPAIGDALAPGGAGQTVAFSVENVGDGVQRLENVDVRIGDIDGEWDGYLTCSVDDYALTLTDPAYGDMDPGDSVSGSVLVQMVNTSENQDDCKNVTVPLWFESTPATVVVPIP